MWFLSVRAGRWGRLCCCGVYRVGSKARRESGQQGDHKVSAFEPVPSFVN